MRFLRRLAIAVGILALVCLVLLTSSTLLQHLAQAHEKARYYLLLSFLIGIGASVTAMLAAFVLEWLLIGWGGSSLAALWKARATVKLDLVSVVVMQIREKHLDYTLTLGLLYLVGTRLARPAGLSIAHWLPSWGLQVGGALYFLFTALTRFNSFVIHSNLDLGYGWVGRWLFVSPRMHRVHHCNSPAYYNRNFSFDFVLWDRLFGTYTLCEEAAQLPIGLVDNPFNTDGSLKGVLRDYFVTTYLEFWRALKEGPRAWIPVRLSLRSTAGDQRTIGSHARPISISRSTLDLLQGRHVAPRTSPPDS